MKVAVSFIKSKYNEKETIDIINQTSADYLHVDIMDGVFVDNKNYDYEDIELFVKDNHKQLDIHLMCNNPLEYIKDYLKLKPYNISFHIEAEKNPTRIIDFLHENNIKCGLAINPETDLKVIIPYLNKIDTVLVMSVHPGKGGQKFMLEIVNKIKELSKLKGNFVIEVDGGVNSDSICHLENVDIVVSGSYICESDDFEEKIRKLRITC